MVKKFKLIKGAKAPSDISRASEEHKLSFYCEDSNKTYIYMLAADHIRMHMIEHNVTTMPKYIAVENIDAIVAFSTIDAKLALGLRFKHNAEITPLFSSCDMRLLLINWRWLSSYYNLPMYLRKSDSSFSYVQDKAPSIYLDLYN